MENRRREDAALIAPNVEGNVWPKQACPVFEPRGDTPYGMRQCWYCRYADFHLDGFTDAGSISQYAKVSMAWAVENGLISGKGKGILDPKKGATRGEVATILTRFNNLYQK